MAKSKDIRITITLECTSCAQKDQTRPAGVSRYTTQKNRRNTPNRLELNKFCKHCGSHSLHKEIKK